MSPRCFGMSAAGCENRCVKNSEKIKNFMRDFFRFLCDTINIASMENMDEPANGEVTAFDEKE